MANWITDIRTFMRGMAKDILKELLPKDKYLEAENVTIMPQQEGTAGGLTPALGNIFSVVRETINIENDGDDYKAFRVQLDVSGIVSHSLTYTIPGFAPVTIFLTSTEPTASARYADLISQINADPFLSVYITPSLTSSTVGYVGVRGFGSDFTMSEIISGEDVDVFIIKEFYGIAGNGTFVLIKSLNIGDNLYQIESNGTVFKLSVAKQDRAADTWQYVTLAQTNTIQIPVDAVIDLDGEINNGNKVSLYFTGSGVEPRVMYVMLQDTWVENSAMIYDETFATLENEDGYFTYESINTNTKLQILENWAIPTLVSVNDSGGGLTTGSKMYMVRQSIGLDNNTGFNFSSLQIPVFLRSLSDTTLCGDIPGLFSSKSITLSISGLNPDLYDFFELICIENNDDAMIAYIVNQYAITAETQQVTHTGFEQTTSITIAELSQQQILIKNAENLVIARNRLFLSNITLVEQPDLTEWAQTIHIVTRRTTIPAIGNAYDTVAEYQSPSNVFNRIGHFVEEIYRWGIVLIFNDKSAYRGMSQPYFVGDHKIDASFDTIGTAIVNGITLPNVAFEPTEVYVYYPEFQVDLSTVQIDGVPLSELVYGYFIVRQPCIPEVLASGYIMPAAEAAPVSGYYTCGGSVAGNGSYSAAPNSSRRNQCSFISPDLLFGTTDILPLSGDIIYNYGQVLQYNNLIEAALPNQIDVALFNEFSTYNENLSPFQHIISAGEVVEFNTDGVVDINGSKLRNLVQFSFPGSEVEVFGNNQKSLALEFSDFINPISPAILDRGFYYALYIRRKPNKYGDFNNGSYLFTGHFRKVVNGTSSYIEEVFGGDAFNQKNITKFNNYYSIIPTDPVAEVSAMGLSYYTQNRGNYQLRNFTASTSSDFPYTTIVLNEWLGQNILLQGQLQYSLSYTQSSSFKLMSSYNPDYPFVANETSTIRYSQLKIENSTLDSYRSFLPLDFKAFPSVYGAIKNTFNYGNAIFVMMDRFICIQQVDLQQQQTDPNNQISIIIGDGTVLGAREHELSFIGAPIKTAGYSYLSKLGKKYFVWFNPFLKKVIQYSDTGMRDLFDDNQMQSFLTQNTTYITGERQFFFCYDYYTSELLMFASSLLSEPTIYDGAETYTKGQKVFTEGGYTNTKYYIATQSVPLNKPPDNVANLYLYWKPYRQSNFALSYNEQSNNIVSFYSYMPTYPLMPYLNTFLSSPDTLLLSQNVYEHNRFTNKFYEDDIKGYVHTVFNIQNQIFKQAIAIFSEINAKPLYIHFVGLSNGEVRSFATPADIKSIRNYWWANVKNDATVTTTNPTGSNSIKTQKIGGEFIEAIIIFENGDQIPITINAASLKMQLKPRNFSI